MQFLDNILPWIASGFAFWCAGCVVRTAVEIWREFRPVPAARAQSEPVPLRRHVTSPLRNAA